MPDPTVTPRESLEAGAGASRRGPRTTARSVLFFDALAGGVVRVGGLLVILAVVGILVFLVATVLPLFRPAIIREHAIAGKVPVEGRVRVLALDEYRLLAAAIGDAPEVVCFRPETAEVVQRFPIAGLEGARIATARRSVRSNEAVVATTDGRLAFLTLGFSSDFVLGKEAEGIRASMTLGQVRVLDGAVVQRKPGGNLLRVRADLAYRGQVALPKAAGAVIAVAYASHDGVGAAVAVTADGKVHLVREAEGSGGEGAPARAYQLASVADTGPGTPGGLFAAFVDEEVRTAWLAARDGAVLRIDLQATPAIRREVKYVGAPGTTRLSAVDLLLGGRSLLVADAAGGLSIWSLVPLEAAELKGPRDPGDGRTLARLHAFEPFASPAVAIEPSATRRSFFLGHEDGSVTMAFATNERVLGRIEAFRGPVEAMAGGSKNDGVLLVGPGLGYRGYEVDCPHPETNVRALFQKIQYEGFSGPEYQYQSSAATDEAELKFSLVPLLFGTLKATFYAMLFALPLALLGALYTSQFMHPRVRAYVKPGVEVMASLPSVVLGFVAALVLAPAVEKVVPGVFAGIFGIACVGFVAGFVWYLIPTHVRQVVSSAQRLLIACLLVAATGWVSLSSTPLIERTLFSGPANPVGDFRIWMLCQPGTGSGLPLLRLGLFVLGGVLGVFLLPRWGALRRGLEERPGVVAGLAKTAVYGLAPALLLALLAWPIEHVLFSDGFRWFLVGKSDKGTGTTYDQRNSLVVGLAMGFAVIPIVYTIAEDAISAIPDSLRSAALGCGASPWQAATRVVLPAAVPGIFSAVMIGLGRAIGETMIVLMAAGGTAILDGSIFNGFRTLSVNIATELPEAPEGGTLYRVLFLAALLLFALTFVLNTVAEVVRIRFRTKFKGL